MQCKLDGQVYCMKTMPKAMLRRARQVGECCLSPDALLSLLL